MIRHGRMVAGEDVVINVVEGPADLPAFEAFVSANAGRPVGCDTETTGLDPWAPGWRLRCVQWATPCEAWVLPSEFFGAIQAALLEFRFPVFHNRVFDCFALTRAGFDHLGWGDEAADTQILAHLADSRSSRDGGVGHGLKNLSDSLIEPGLSGDQAEIKAWAKSEGVSSSDLFRVVPFPLLSAYAGMDAVLTVRLWSLLSAKVAGMGCGHLVPFELALQRCCAEMAETGFRVDLDYAEWLGGHLESVSEAAAFKLRALGVDNPASPAQVAERLIADGVDLKVKTDGGKPSVSSDALVGVRHPIAELIGEYRGAAKLKASYVDRVISSASDSRVHANIRTLGARTGRFAVSSPALQQLPAGDALVRRMFIADEGYSLCSVDYSAIELRILAALSGEKSMLKAISAGEDLHQNAASLMGVTRKTAKMANFLTVYGGGSSQLAVQAEISPADARAALAAFRRSFPAIGRYSKRLQRAACSGAVPVKTPSKRLLHLDRDRLYAATNYVVQSAARDVLGEAILRVDDSPLGGSMLLPVHDEIIFQVPTGEANRSVAAMVELMSTDFGPSVHLAATGEVMGRSWGHGYNFAATPAERWFK